MHFSCNQSMNFSFLQALIICQQSAARTALPNEACVVCQNPHTRPVSTSVCCSRYAVCTSCQARPCPLCVAGPRSTQIGRTMNCPQSMWESMELIAPPQASQANWTDTKWIQRFCETIAEFHGIKKWISFEYDFAKELSSLSVGLGQGRGRIGYIVDVVSRDDSGNGYLSIFDIRYIDIYMNIYIIE